MVVSVCTDVSLGADVPLAEVVSYPDSPDIFPAMTVIRHLKNCQLLV